MTTDISMKTVVGIIAFGLITWGLVNVFESWAREIKEREDWLAKHCTVIGEVSSSVGTSVGPIIGGNNNGGVLVGTVFIPGKTGYKCDDGKEYWE